MKVAKGVKVKCLVVQDKIIKGIRNGKIQSPHIRVDKENFIIETEPLDYYKRSRLFPSKQRFYPLFICDVNSHKTIPLINEKVYDVKIDNQINYLSEQKFWKGLQDRLKLDRWSIMIYLCAGFGLFRFIEYIIQHIFTRV